MCSSRVICAWLLACIAGCCGVVLGAESTDSTTAGAVPAGLAADTSPISSESYVLQPGDIIDVSVWKETDLQREVLIRPDGGFTFPLAGEVDARGRSVEKVRSILAERLQKYVPTPVVTVAVKSIGGNRIYVLGKVNHAGDFPLSTSLDVMQAISLAGGTTPYASVNDIVILRRQNGRQQALNFHYSDVARGRNLAQNIQLESGDTVVVP
jgi:polysaccharide biosynthesis/export protein